MCSVFLCQLSNNWCKLKSTLWLLFFVVVADVLMCAVAVVVDVAAVVIVTWLTESTAARLVLGTQAT